MPIVKKTEAYKTWLKEPETRKKLRLTNLLGIRIIIVFAILFFAWFLFCMVLAMWEGR